MRARLAILALLPAVAAGGCADLMTVRQQAPVWFEQAQRELKGEGYPDLCEVPGPQSNAVNEAAWDRDASAIRAIGKDMEATQARLGPIPTEEEIRAKAAQMRAEAGLDAEP